MPYELRGNCVHKKGDDKPLKCYDNKQDALAYLRALEANVSDAKQEKQVDSETAQQLVDIINEFVQRVDTELGITEAVANPDEQPPPEDGEEAPSEDDNSEHMDDEEEMDADGNPKKKKPSYEKSKQYWLEQKDVSYTPDYAGEAHCSSCRWFVAQSEYGGMNCHIVANWPAPIVPNGTCERHEAVPPPMEMETGMAEIATAMFDENGKVNGKSTALPSHALNLSSAAQTSTVKPGGFLSKLKNLVARTDATPEGGNFQVFKGKDERWYWLARHTNNFEDRDKEILTEQAHDGYIARLNLGIVDMPELWAWHTKGSRHGQADVVWRHHHFIFALGHFDDTPEAQKAVHFYQRQRGQVELSHGFMYPSWALKDGKYSTYNTFEITTLPPQSASNPYTSFEEIKAMALDEKRRQWIKKTLGDEGLARVERAQSEADKDGELLKALDKRYKDFADTIQDNGTDTMQVDLKALLKLNAELIGAQGAIEAEATAQKATVEAVKDKLEQLEAENAALKAQLDGRPKMASTDLHTLIKDQKDLPKDVQDSLYEEHPLFGRLKPKA